MAYCVDGAETRGVFVAPTSPAGKAIKVRQGCGWVFGWTPDSKQALFHPKEGGGTIKALDVETRVVREYLGRPRSSLYQSRPSPDGPWLVVECVPDQVQNSAGEAVIYMVKLENGAPAAQPEFILVSDAHGWSDKPHWSPDGNLIYYVSMRDGFACLWAQRLDAKTKKPTGAAFAVYHFHRSRFSLHNVSLGLLEIGVARGRVVFGLGELTGNLWRITQP